MVTHTLSPTVYVKNYMEIVVVLMEFRSSHLMAHTLSLHPGTRLFVSGNWPPAILPVLSSVTPTMSSPFPSPQTTDKSSLDLETERSSSGTHWATANLPSQTRVTPIGFRASDSLQIHKTPSSSALVGTSLSRYVHIVSSPLAKDAMRFHKYLLLQSPRGHETNIHQSTDGIPFNPSSVLEAQSHPS